MSESRNINFQQLIHLTNQFFSKFDLLSSHPKEYIDPLFSSKALFKHFLRTLNSIVQFPEIDINSYVKVMEYIAPEIKKQFTPEEIFPKVFNRRFAVLCLIKFDVLAMSFVLDQVTPVLVQYFETNTDFIADNPDEIALIIRKDNVDEFKTKIEKSEINSQINYSIFERCQFVNDATYLEYASFFNSNKIVNYLIENGAEKTEKFHICQMIHNFKNNKQKNEEKKNLTQHEREILIEYHRLDVNDFDAVPEDNEKKNLYRFLLKCATENCLEFLPQYFPLLSDQKTSIKPALNAICEAGRDDLIKIILSDTEMASQIDWNGKIVKTNQSIFESAIKSNQVEVVQSLFDVKGIDIRGIYYHEESVLHLAAKYDTTVIGHFLLSTKKINVNCKDSVFDYLIYYVYIIIL
ncbi:hypothetical protein TRFO_09971 [Tritrichomonas foetus]|uniref:DUF3447 domain-containing protein n=1 Tax=Tritrichomonas foetus TaxID=1144522 RepID=A0A1J4JGJ8_9EUKA|nr:hypothetical protein TRFO_09971 [Tritrichomonas foetus]|eukprot:OHS96332.1 hypothetical protein TRFO_09971 [Tritrichomonas foetus]